MSYIKLQTQYSTAQYGEIMGYEWDLWRLACSAVSLKHTQYTYFHLLLLTA